MVIKLLQQYFDEDRVLYGDKLKERYYHIWEMNNSLKAKAVILPTKTADLSVALRICNDHKQKIVIHGGLTNLVGSTETEGDEVVISLEKMNQIEEVDVKSRTMTVQSGVILENIQKIASQNDLLFPLNFGAKGSAQIGGIISTNAGGLRVFKYGMTRHLVLGLEVVLADGTILSTLKKIIKDNSAYDLKQLFIGSEGTLGIITKAVIKLVEAPKSRNSAFVAIDTYNKVVDFLKYMDSGLAGTLSGFELIWKETYRRMTSPPALAKPPLKHGSNYYVLLESLGSNQEEDKARMQALLLDAFQEEMILDAALADTQSDLQWFWKIREDVRVVTSQCNHDQHFDISLPIAKIGETIDTIISELYNIPEVELVVAFGHVADGNIHLVVGKSKQTPELIHQINTVVYYPLQELGGSISAEHGIGLHKKPYLHLSRTDAEISLMKTLKRTLDPNNILNRGKIFDL